MAADEQRIYSDDEFALILRKAAEMASQDTPSRSTRDGLTLAEMQAASQQAGIDPLHVERAARMLDMQTTSTTFERIVGGPLRHEHGAYFPVALNEAIAAKVLSAVRLNTHFHSADPGESSTMGLSWKASGDGNVLSVVARPDADGTSVSVVIDRRGTFVLIGVLSAISVFASLVVATGVNSVAPSLTPWAALACTGGALAVARRFWVSSTAKAQERIGALMDTIGKTLARSDAERIP